MDKTEIKTEIKKEGLNDKVFAELDPDPSESDHKLEKNSIGNEFVII